MGRLDGKVAIVTGAAGGQGEAEARIFAKEGAKVVLTDIQEDKVARVTADIVAQGGEAISFKHDITSDEEWAGIVGKTVETYGTIDILMSNAGTGGRGGRAHGNFNQQEWDSVLNINIMGTVYGMKNVIPVMQKAGRGSIINVSSLSAMSGMGGSSPYTASKAAVRYLSKAAAMELGKDNIRVNALVPGLIRTPMTEAIIDNADHPLHGIWKAKMKLPRFGTPQDMAYAALFLASDESEHVTGIELPVDGGYLIN